MRVNNMFQSKRANRKTIEALWQLERERQKVRTMQRIDYIGALMCVGVLAITIPIVITFMIVWLIM